MDTTKLPFLVHFVNRGTDRVPVMSCFEWTVRVVMIIIDYWLFTVASVWTIGTPELIVVLHRPVSRSGVGICMWRLVPEYRVPPTLRHLFCPKVWSPLTWWHSWRPTTVVRYSLLSPYWPLPLTDRVPTVSSGTLTYVSGSLSICPNSNSGLSPQSLRLCSLP